MADSVIPSVNSALQILHGPNVMQSKLNDTKNNQNNSNTTKRTVKQMKHM